MIKQVAYRIYPLFKSRPDFLIIGVQRAGTSSLYQYLIRHPEIWVTHSFRETYYFDNSENYAKGLGWYLKHFPSKIKKGNKLTFEASPSYIYYQQIPKLIQQDLGNIKMISLLRNPVARAYSAWQMYHSYSQLSLKHLKEKADQRTFAEAIEQEFHPETNTATSSYDYIDRGKYVEQLENYYNYFPKESILILNFNEFCQDLESVLHRICNFLNIDSFPQVMIEQFQKEKYAQAKYVRNPDDAEILERLKNYFVPFNEKLYDLLGDSYNW